MVFFLDVDAPEIVARAGAGTNADDVSSGEHRGEHGVVLVVVPMHAVASD